MKELSSFLQNRSVRRVGVFILIAFVLYLLRSQMNIILLTFIFFLPYYTFREFYFTENLHLSANYCVVTLCFNRRSYHLRIC